ncbi:TPA: hypothetical protein DDW35_09785 [Candidatus Sumerlaeota bacterium]|nr:hypothetical protein [Candidatus Sumerlaeota bacterium]
MLLRYKNLLLPLAVFLLPFALYLRTLCPGIYPGDGPELTAAAYTLGIPHPTGYSLFMVLGFLFTHLGLGSPAFSMNLLTAIFGALACVGAYFFQKQLWALIAGKERANSLPLQSCMATVAVMLGVSSMWWDQSNETEVYSCMLVLVTFAWTLGLRLIETPTRKNFLQLCAFSGIGFLHHQLFLVTLPLTGMGALMLLREQQRAKTPYPALALRILLPAIVCFAVPLVIGLSYLPIRARALPPINSGDPSTLTRLYYHISGGQFRGTRVLTVQTAQGLHKITLSELPAHISKRTASIVEWMGKQITPGTPDNKQGGNGLAVILIACAIFGGIALLLKQRQAALGLAGVFALNFAVVVVYTIQDIEAYQLPLWTLVCCLAPLGIILGPGIFLDMLEEKEKVGWLKGMEKRAWAACGLFAILGIFSIVNYYDPALGVNKSQSDGLQLFTKVACKSLPPNAIIFTGGDYDIYPLWYTQSCEKQRPDVAIIGSNFIFSRWYASMLKATLPEGLRVFIGDEPPSSEERWLVAFMGGMLVPALESGRPMYLTSMISQTDLQIIGNTFELTPKFKLPTPLPEELEQKGIQRPELFLFELTDPKGNRTMVKERFRQTFSAQADSMMVQRVAHP